MPMARTPRIRIDLLWVAFICRDSQQVDEVLCRTSETACRYLYTGTARTYSNRMDEFGRFLHKPIDGIESSSVRPWRVRAHGSHAGHDSPWTSPHWRATVCTEQATASNELRRRKPLYRFLNGCHVKPQRTVTAKPKSTLRIRAAIAHCTSGIARGMSIAVDHVTTQRLMTFWRYPDFVAKPG